jgi:transcriptional regulator GlxA family with amidase domain
VRQATEQARRSLFEEASVIVAARYREPLTLVAMAAGLAVSPRQLQRAYAEIAGTTFAEQLRARRLQAAAALLAGQPGLTVAEVAVLSGHRSDAHLRRAFRAAHGCSPASFRKALQHPP